MIILDAVTIIAWQEDTNVHHRAATQLIADAAYHGHDLVVNSVTLAEYLVGAVRRGDEVAAEMAITEAGVTVVDSPCKHWARHLARTRERSGLRMPDAIVLATALALGAEVATFDNKLANAALTFGVLYQP